MVRIWSVLVVMVACLVAVNFASAQEKKGKKGDRPSPEQRWGAIAKAAEKEGATELTKDEFVKGVKATAPTKLGDHAEDMFKRIKKASEDKITKDEYIAGMKEMRGKHSKGEKQDNK